MILAGAIVLAAGGCGTGVTLPTGPLTVTTIASGLDIPWAMASVADGRLFFAVYVSTSNGGTDVILRLCR